MRNNKLIDPESPTARLNKDFEEFVYIVSHDLKAPVRAISNLSVWIEEDLGENIPADVHHNIRLLRNRTDRLESMLTCLLQVSRITRRDLDVKPVDLGEYLPEIAKPFLRKQVFIFLPDNLPVLTTYYKKLQQVFEQLFLNAIAYSDKERVEITVKANNTPDYIWFTVHDNGPGIAPENASKIYDIFYTGRSKDNDDAMGAGLTIVKQIMEFVGGSVELLPVSTGTSFLIGWPKQVNNNF